MTCNPWSVSSFYWFATETNPDLVIGKINVDEEGELAQSFGIRSIPQLYISKNGKIVQNISGYVSADVILGAIK